MTNQQIFNKVAKHLMTQKKKAIKRGICQYRTKTGLMCAVGCLIPDKKYKPEFEGHTIGVYAEDTEKKIIAAAGLRGAKQIEFAGVLQSIHDGTRVANWKGELLAIAANFGLRLPKELKS